MIHFFILLFVVLPTNFCRAMDAEKSAIQHTVINKTSGLLYVLYWQNITGTTQQFPCEVLLESQEAIKIISPATAIIVCEPLPREDSWLEKGPQLYSFKLSPKLARHIELGRNYFVETDVEIQNREIN